MQVVEQTVSRRLRSTRNAGAAPATAPLLVFLDDDVVAHPGALQRAPRGRSPTPLSSAAAAGLARPGSGPSGWFPTSSPGWSGLPRRAADNQHGRAQRVEREHGRPRRRVRGRRRLPAGFRKRWASRRVPRTRTCASGSAAAHRARGSTSGAVIDHAVPPNVGTLRFFLRRCFSEGAGKIELSGPPGQRERTRAMSAVIFAHAPARVLRDCFAASSPRARDPGRGRRRRRRRRASRESAR